MLISFRIYGFNLLAVQRSLKSLPQHHSLKALIFHHPAFFTVQLSHLYMTMGKTKQTNKQTKKQNIALTISGCLLSCFSHVRPCGTQWNITYEAPLSMGFSKQEYWSGFPYLPLGDLPNPGIKPTFLMSPALAGRFFTTKTI